ncbi:DoxX family protein [Roseomonas elaeocarpi]|uniref:DoxX family protein n=1 Tax=Roseomonas elaeocarpi TaxID=907779 RepID=A0ABV6JPY5_9PROT
MASTSPRIRGRAIARRVLAALYLIAGVFHLLTPGTFLLIMPDWVPFPRQVILATGACELLGATGLLTRRLRAAAGVALALYAVCVFPANIKHAVEGIPGAAVQLGWWYHAPRLLLQPVLVWWALFAGEVTDWPFGRAGRRSSP